LRARPWRNKEPWKWRVSESLRVVSVAKVHTRLARGFETASLRLACPRRGQALKRSAEGFGSCPTEIHCPRRVFSSALRRLLADAFGTPSTSGSRPRSALSPHRRRPRWLWGRRGSTLTSRRELRHARSCRGRRRGARGSDRLRKRRCCAREFAVDMAMQAFRSPAAAKGGVEAFAEIPGEEWKSCETRSEAQVEKKAAEAQMAAFGC
jgi:hypothetical protein